ncbi:hypothetical protein EYF80_063130 [Liparis tanakae]|uniref:Uncharacterized protein n=1 Tax=Liparis tanakae TaxID=230148 RepID=A0A4Z2EDB4_9TELE|nr:hypothetical protein EYF80_063130 [Liparis tanakae]
MDMSAPTSSQELAIPNDVSVQRRGAPCSACYDRLQDQTRAVGGQDQTRPDQTRPDQTRPDQTRLDQTRLDQARPGQTRPDQARPD